MLNDADILYCRMAATITKLNFCDMSRDECLQLAADCEETRTGLCHCLSFIGESLVTLASHEEQNLVPANLFHLGHSLTAISSLLPMLIDLEQFIRADLRNMEI